MEVGEVVAYKQLSGWEVGDYLLQTTAGVEEDRQQPIVYKQLCTGRKFGDWLSAKNVLFPVKVGNYSPAKNRWLRQLCN